MSQDRQPVTWNKGMERRTVRCGADTEGRGGIGRSARSAARAGAEMISAEDPLSIRLSRGMDWTYRPFRTRGSSGPYAEY